MSTGHGHGHVHMSVDTPKQPTANVQTTIRLVQTSLHLSGQARSEVDEVEVYEVLFLHCASVSTSQQVLPGPPPS